MRRLTLAVLAAFSLLGSVGPMLAQDKPAEIQMRPDEAFWNAIRDTGDRKSFELFLQTFPGSPYAPDAQKMLDGAIAVPKSPPSVKDATTNNAQESGSSAEDPAQREKAVLENLALRGVSMEYLKDRIRLVLGSGRAELTDRQLWSALQQELGFAVDGHPSTQLIGAALRRNVELLPTTHGYLGLIPSQSAGEQKSFADWKFSIIGKGVEKKACLIWTSLSGMDASRGLFAMAESPGIYLLRFEDTDGIGLISAFVNAEVFDDETPIKLNDRRGFMPLEKSNKNREMIPIPDLTALVRSDSVLISGGSRLGGALSFRLSAQGFVKAFRELDKVCGGSKLAAKWL